MWATAPFLHNGSVPSLYLLLSSQTERDAEATRFFLGSRAFDPRHVGYYYRTNASPTLPEVPVLADATGMFELDTTIPGNRNTGHLFTDKQVAGRIKRALSVEERFAIIAFIKSM